MSKDSLHEYPYTPKGTPFEERVEYNGANFATTFWPVPEKVQISGRVIFLHGFSEYSKIYTRLFDQLSQSGYEVFFFDQRGSGLTSPGKLKGITNEFYTFDDLDHFVKLNLTKLAETGNQKLYLGGHSMGGGICLNYGVHGKYKDKISGIFVTGPLILLHPSTRPNRLLFNSSALLMKIMPNHTMDTGLNEDYVTSDPAYRDFVKNDTVVNPLIGSLRQMYDFIKRGETLTDKNYLKNFSVPVLIFHGIEDKINWIDASAKFIDDIPITDKKLVRVNDSRHTIAIETEAIFKEFLTQTIEFLRSH